MDMFQAVFAVIWHEIMPHMKHICCMFRLMAAVKLHTTTWGALLEIPWVHDAFGFELSLGYHKFRNILLLLFCVIPTFDYESQPTAWETGV